MLLAYELINTNDPDGICELSGYALNESNIFDHLHEFFKDYNFTKTYEEYDNNEHASRYSVIHWYEDIKMQEYYDLFVYETNTILI